MLPAQNIYVSVDSSSGVWIYLDPFSERIRIDDYHGSPAEVLRMVERHYYDWVGKVILKSRPGDRDFFKSAGFQQEAYVKGYFAGMDMHFLTRYPKPERSIKMQPPVESGYPSLKDFPTDPVNHFIPVLATEKDAEELTAFYREIFPIYPTPIDDPSYLKKMIAGDSVYILIRHQGRIVSAACAEVNRLYKNAELSDCATLAEYGGKGLMKMILKRIMEDVVKLGIVSVYSIVRIKSPSMNQVFQNLGFECTGKLIQNVKIGTGLEDMYVWSRLL